MALRPFEDLIKPLEIDGETFVPIEEIAKLAIAPNLGVKVKFGKPKFLKTPSSTLSIIVKYTDGWRKVIQIDKSFDIVVWLDNRHFLIFNQVQIVKSLIKWGFVEA